MVAMLAAVAALGAACGGEDGPVAAGTLPPPQDPGGSTAPAGTTGGGGGGGGGEETPAATTSLEVWFTRGEGLHPAMRDVPQTRSVGRAALEQLLGGPTAAERRDEVGSQVPPGTRLLGLDIGDGIATVDLSGEYESGGGTLSMTMRLAQVVYTLTQFPTVDGVRFRLDGAPVNVFSGEGIVIEEPLRRADYDELLPAIVVERPAAGARVSSPALVSGTANVFEANVTVAILDASGRELARNFTTATCGSGCRGDFRIELPFTVTADGRGTIVVSDDDADGDGRPAHEVRIPVMLVAG
jgi:hypothetical protein